MSYCQLLEIDIENWDFSTLKEYKNAHGLASFLWSYICVEYLGKPETAWRRGDDASWFWMEHTNKSIPKHIRVAFLFTFDGFWVHKDDFKEFGVDLIFCTTQMQNWVEGRVDHWPKLAGDVTNLALSKDLDNLPDAIGLYANSVSDNPFDMEDQKDLIPYKNLYKYLKAIDSRDE